MPSYNRVILIGRLTRDPELRYTSGGLAVTKFAIAVDRRFKNQAGERQTDFFDCTAWRQKAEFVANYVGKGRLVAIDGSIEFNEATGQDGQKRRYTNIVCDNVETLDGPRDAGEGAGGGMDAQAGAMGGGNGGGMGGAQARGGNAGSGNRPAPANTQADDDNGYFPDEDAPAAPAPRAQAARPAQGGGANAGGANAGGANAGGANAGGANAGGAAARPAAGGARPQAAPQPAYPEDDFDDSDPFADQ